MNKLSVDTGRKEFEINGQHMLRFNPSDPNVYNRFMEAHKEILAIESQFEQEINKLGFSDEVDEKGFAKTENAMKIMRGADVKVKEMLSYVFGTQNNFDEILDGVNVLAFGTNGERVITNLLHALMPVIEGGMQDYTDAAAKEAVEQANLNREQRRALAKKQ